jgi:hypothetical protein
VAVVTTALAYNNSALQTLDVVLRTATGQRVAAASVVTEALTDSG